MPHNGGFALQFVTNLLITLGRWKNEIISTSYITSHTPKKKQKKQSQPKENSRRYFCEFTLRAFDISSMITPMQSARMTHKV